MRGLLWLSLMKQQTKLRPELSRVIGNVDRLVLVVFRLETNGRCYCCSCCRQDLKFARHAYQGTCSSSNRSPGRRTVITVDEKMHLCTQVLLMSLLC